MDPDQTAPIGAVCSGSTLFASMLNLSVMLGNYLQQTTSADNIFRCIFFLGTLRVKTCYAVNWSLRTDVEPPRAYAKVTIKHWCICLKNLLRCRLKYGHVS